MISQRHILSRNVRSLRCHSVRPWTRLSKECKSRSRTSPVLSSAGSTIRTATTTGMIDDERLHRSLLSARRHRGERRQSTALASIDPSNDNDDIENTSQNQYQRHPVYPETFSPLTLGCGLTLPNRVVMGSMHSGLEPHSIPRWLTSHEYDPEALAEYYAERVRGGVGLLVTGGVAPNRRGWVGPFAAKLTTEAEADIHRRVLQSTKARAAESSSSVSSLSSPKSAFGGLGLSEEDARTKICLQILHAGRYALHPFPVAPTALKAPISPFTPRALSESEVRQTVDDYARCAALARSAGYDGVEVMGSEGYLIHQFLSASTNHRGPNDVYGRDRSRFALDIVRAIVSAAGEDFLLVYRLSMLDLMTQSQGQGQGKTPHNNGGAGSSWEETLDLAEALEDAGVHVLNAGVGWHESRVPTIATGVPRAAFAHLTAAKLKRSSRLRPETAVVATNRINDPAVIEELLRDDACDLVSMARPFLADPDFLRKMRTGREREINTCVACNQACLDYAFVGRTVSCMVRPRTGNELWYQQRDEERRIQTKERERAPSSHSSPILTVAVVGAGPAGMACAVTAAELGHKVVLYESSDKVGGQFLMASAIPGKEEFKETLRYYKVQMDLLSDNLELRLGTTVEASDLTEYDRVVVATGVVPRVPDIPGMNAHMSLSSSSLNATNTTTQPKRQAKILTYRQVLMDGAPVGKRVAILGAGGIGFDVAEYLLHPPAASSTLPSTNNKNDGDDNDNDNDNNNNSNTSQSVLPDPTEFFRRWKVDPTNEARGGLIDDTTTTTTTTTTNADEGNKTSDVEPRQLYLLQRKVGKLGAGLGRTTGWIHRTNLRDAGVTMINGCTYERFDENGDLHLTVRGKGSDNTEHVKLEVDTVVLCTGQLSHRNLADELMMAPHEEEEFSSGSIRNNDGDSNMRPPRTREEGRDLFVIGGAFQAGELDARRAIEMGTRLAYDLTHSQSHHIGEDKRQGQEGPPVVQVYDEDQRTKGDEERVASWMMGLATMKGPRSFLVGNTGKGKSK